jgi:hypothetical protein
MENHILDDGYANPNQGGLSSLDKEYLLTAAKWSRFLGIVSFVATALLVVIAFFFTTLMGKVNPLMGAAMPISGGLGAFVTLFYLLIAAVYFFVSLYLYHFGTKTKAALLSNDTEMLTEGLKNLKSFFSLVGILTAILVSLYGIIFLFALIGLGVASTQRM